MYLIGQTSKLVSFKVKPPQNPLIKKKNLIRGKRLISVALENTLCYRKYYNSKETISNYEKKQEMTIILLTDIRRVACNSTLARLRHHDKQTNPVGRRRSAFLSRSIRAMITNAPDVYFYQCRRKIFIVWRRENIKVDYAHEKHCNARYLGGCD